MEPLLPPELERNIFAISALSDSTVIPALILVAHRVKIWIEPLLYRIVSLDPRQTKHHVPEHVFLKALESKPANLWQDHTRHLSLGIPNAEQLDRILALCNHTSNLALFHINWSFRWAKFLPRMAAMPLVRLAANLCILFKPEVVDFDHSVFAHITHLTSNYPCGPFDGFLRDVFAHCISLEVFVFRYKNEVLRDCLHYYAYFADEPRAVVLGVDDFLKDWEIGAEGGVDYWVRAERFIKQRQSGEINPREYGVFQNEEEPTNSDNDTSA
ncbi:hypothetical protein C8R43DRAFT_1202884 [Mycena crocata]|nr:hypothetical protein C8R43DRAFT_1202884 [Mycena crocata]